MPLKWFKSPKVEDTGITLADTFISQISRGPAAGRKAESRQRSRDAEGQRLLASFLRQVDRQVETLTLNTFRKAQLANTFKWRLREAGLDRGLIDELTQALLLRLSASAPSTSQREPPPAAPSRRTSGNARQLLAEGDAHLARGAYLEAIASYEHLLSLHPRDPVAHNNLGAALCKLGRYRDAEDQFRRAAQADAGNAEAQCNLGTVLRWRGHVAESESYLRRALRLKPAHLDAQINLAATLFMLGRWPEARRLLERVLKVVPRSTEALVLLGQIAAPEGRRAEAETLFERAAQIDANAPAPWAAMASLRQMTSADADWLKRGEEIAARGALAPRDEAIVRFAIGKYYDDVGNFKRAFRAFERANELQQMAVEPYDRTAHTQLVDDLSRVYTREVLATAQGATDSAKPVFVVGMPRSGTSLVEQIIASHPSARGAGELGFWSTAMSRFETEARYRPIGPPLSQKLATDYLRLLDEHAAGAARVVDKATFNAEYLGVIHSVFPRARMLYLRRDPIDVCLSCYFHQLPEDMSFAMDLSDLAHYYREHARLVAHWRRALPPGTLLDVPYAELVADQERWTRKIVEFIGLDWDPRCLSFQNTERVVRTSSYRQVRQKMYQTSVGRWRHYAKYLGPLLELRDDAG